MKHPTPTFPLERYIHLLKSCIRTPSFSREEDKTADILYRFFSDAQKHPQRLHNNIYLKSKGFDTHPKLPRILLVSHHDTVKPGASWKADPFCAEETADGKIVGLGSNDAGASLVSLVAAFEYIDQCAHPPCALVLALVAEEEITGEKGLRSLLPHLGKMDVAIVGEPTRMQAAIAEKGLLVLDATTYGKSGHAARKDGINAIHLALKDIQWIEGYAFEKISPLLGEVHLNVTQIQAGTQHNVIPDQCHYVVDVRTNEYYTHQEILSTLQKHLAATLVPRSTHLQSSATPANHPILQALNHLGIATFGSPTLSDWCVLSPIPAIKIGPGDSLRSHQPDEYIYRKEIEQGIATYLHLLTHLGTEYENLG